MRHLAVFTAFLKTDVNSGIQILAPWRFSLEGMGSSGVPLSNALFKLLSSLIIAFFFVFEVVELLCCQGGIIYMLTFFVCFFIFSIAIINVK